MYISKAEIRHFRALREVEVPLNKCSVLIGENDVGKTSLLLALDRFFRAKKINNTEDFFNGDMTTAVVITLTFSELPSRQEIEEIRKTDGTVTLRKTFVFDKAVDVKAVMDDGSEKPVSKSVFENELSDENFRFIPVRRDISVQFSMAKTALLGGTLRTIMAGALKANDRDQSVEKIEKLLSDSLDDPKQQLQLFLQQQMNNDRLKLQFADVKIDPVDGVSLRPKLSDDKIQDIPIENRGAGTQNNLVIALFRLVARVEEEGKLIFAMEEPENSLHPKAQRQLLSVLQELSDKSQIIVTTHSPVFVERSKFENNIILTRLPNGTTIAKTFDLSKLNELRTELGIRPSDALLKGGGNCAIIVEGSTEEDGFPTFMEMLGMSSFKLGTAIIPIGGSNYSRIEGTAKLLGAYGIPCVVVLDSDAKETAENVARACSQGTLDNVRKVYCLKDGTIEDYYPLEVIAEVFNKSYAESLSSPITENDFDKTKHGSARVKDFERVLFEKMGSNPGSYIKKLIGSEGTRLMRDKAIPVPDELKEIFEEVQRIVNEI